MNKADVFNLDILKTNWTYALSPKARIQRLARFLRSTSSELELHLTEEDSGFSVLIISEMADPEKTELRKRVGEFEKTLPVKLPPYKLEIVSEQEFFAPVAQLAEP